MHWVGINFVESQFERGEGGSVARQSGGEAGSEQTKNTAVGKPVSVTL